MSMCCSSIRWSWGRGGAYSPTATRRPSSTWWTRRTPRPVSSSRRIDLSREIEVGRVVDLSHPIEAGLITYPGLPAPEFGDHLTREASRAHYAPGTEFHIGRISMVGNTGTYLDTPFHRYSDGSDLAATPLDR